MEKWTQSQKEAINSKGSTLVTASAGTGKTSVLTEKVASLFQQNVGIDQILVMTFSSAAAEEMKERIRNKLYNIFKEEKKRDKRRFLYSQIKLLHTANIKTIHAFCNDIVKKYYYEIGLNQNVEVGNTFDIAILKRKAIEKVLEKEFKTKDKDFIALMEYFDNSEEISDIFINTHEKIFNNIDPEKWLMNAVEKYNVNETTIPDFMKNKIISDFSLALSFYTKASFEIDAADDKKLAKAEKIINDDINIIEQIINLIQSGNIHSFDSSLINSFGATIRFPADYSDIKELRNKGKDIVDKYKKTKFNIPNQLERLRYMYPIVKKYANIILAFNKEYSAMKTAENIIDFHDMEYYANKILDNKNISLLFKNKFKYVFVDEYQDTSPIQEAIIKKISGVNNLFCVGDQKQSIYGFRASEPALFIDRDKAYREKKIPGKVITLNNNFRSSKNILDCANDVFFNISQQSKEIKYDSDEALIHGRNDKNDNNPVIVKLIPDSIKEQVPELNADEIEVFNIVNTIKEKMESTVYDPSTGEYRKVKYSDISILCRKLTNISEYFVKIFTDNKIPFIIEKSGGLLSTVEVSNLINIFELSNNINNDIAIISFIHEGFLGFTDDDLISIRMKDYDKSLIENMNLISEESTDIGIKCKKFINFFKSIKEQEKYLGLNELVNYIIKTINFIDYYAIQENGKQKVANIKLFQQYVFNYSQKHNDKIFGFLNYIDQLKHSNVIIDEAKVNYSEDSVRITTIHKSKGLEYPIVILPFMGKAFSTIDKRTNVNVERNTGIGFKYFNYEKEEKGKTFLRTIIDDTISEKSKEEEMRLLYVAMTRAKEELIIQGNMAQTKTTASLIDASCMLDWVVSTVISSKSESVFDTELSSRLKGNWKIEIAKYENIEKYLENKVEPVEKDVFLSRYSMPSTDIEEEIIKTIDRNIPTTISASKILQEEESLFKKPNFIGKNSSEKIGTATHDFLKYIDFNGDLSYFGLLDQKEDIIDKKLMRQEDVDLVDLIKLEKFFESELAQMIKTADKIEKEKSISILESADNVGFYSMNTKEILVRCILDLMFEKDGEWYLVDYKTDKINDENDDNELTNKILSHRTQLSFYEKAIKKIYGITIKDSYIVFLDIGKAFKIFKTEID